MYLPKNYLNIIVFASIQFAIINFDNTIACKPLNVFWSNVALSDVAFDEWMNFILVHLSRRLKCTIVIMRCPSSICRC